MHQLQPRHSRRCDHAGRTAALPLLGLCVALLVAPGCLSPGHPLTPRESQAARAARPILSLEPDAQWTDCYNRLVELGPGALAYLARQPALTQPAAPDDLGVLLHVSLLRLLADPATAPRLSATCLETSLDVLHFDLKVGGQPVGRVVLADPEPPSAWHELFPLDFDHRRAARIDLEADRQALRAWWLAQRADRGGLVTPRRLNPKPEHLWRLLARRYADAWTYDPGPRAVLCATGPPREPVLLQVTTYDYNLVRAACIWLGSRGSEQVQGRLVELVGSPLPIVSYNARFALHYADDERIRAVLRRHERPPAPPSSR